MLCHGREVRVEVPAARVVFRDEDRAEITSAISSILASGGLTLGPYTERFETAFAEAHSASNGVAPHAVATSSGTAALDIVLRTAGVVGRDVVVPANTFFATAAAVLQAGGRPVFADIDAATLALSRATVEAALTPATAAVVLVHIGGLITPEVGEIRRLCDERGVVLVEDAAHAHGSTYDVRLGSAMRMSELHAVTGLVHLRQMDAAIERRRSVAARYTKELAQLDGLEPLPEPIGCRSNFYKYVAVLPQGVDRMCFKRELADRHSVRLSGAVYDLPLHKQPVFETYAGTPLPVAEDLCARHVCLPVHSDMREDEVDHVLSAVSHAYSSFAGVCGVGMRVVVTGG